MNVAIKKPQFVMEIEAHTGLTCEYHDEEWPDTPWWVLSPTGIRLFEVGGEDDLIHTISQPRMFDIQRVDLDERTRRRDARRKRESKERVQ